jgi:uncharacterized membrane protein YGL010W
MLLCTHAISHICGEVAACTATFTNVLYIHACTVYYTKLLCCAVTQACMLFNVNLNADVTTVCIRTASHYIVLFTILYFMLYSYTGMAMAATGGSLRN